MAKKLICSVMFLWDRQGGGVMGQGAKVVGGRVLLTKRKKFLRVLTTGHGRAWGSQTVLGFLSYLWRHTVQQGRSIKSPPQYVWEECEEDPGDIVTEKQGKEHGKGAAPPTRLTTHRAPKEDPRDKVPFSSHIPFLSYYIKGTHYWHDLLLMLAFISWPRYCFLGFTMVKLFFFFLPLSTLYSLEVNRYV